MTDTASPENEATPAATPAKDGEVLPPLRDPIIRESSRPIVVSALNRIRNQVIQKELASYAAKIRTWNEVVTALRDS